MQPEHRPHSGSARGLELPQAGGLFDPVKTLLDPLPGVDRLAVALMPSGASVDGGATAVLNVLRHMRRDASKADVGHKVPGVVALVGSQRFPVSAREGPRHPQCRRPLPIPFCWGHLTGHHHAMAVLHEAVPHLADERPGAVRLAELPCIPIAAAAVGLVGEQQTAEIPLDPLLPRGGT
jgi:hypothetical protein